jgi:hypothetical protein
MLLYGARAAALGDSVILAKILGNAMQQLTVLRESLLELRRSYSEVKKVAEYADDAGDAARSFQQFSTRRFGDRFLSDLDAARPDLERFRADALGGLGMSGSEWARGTGTLARLSTYCLGEAAGRPACVQLRGQLEGGKVVLALARTFGRDATVEVAAVDAEVAAAIQGDAAQARLSSLQRARVRELLRQCNSSTDLVSSRDAKRIAEECRSAAEQAQLLHLEEGQETNVKLAQIARLQAVGVEQRNADLKRELEEQAARRVGLTLGLDSLLEHRVSIRSGGLQF